MARPRFHLSVLLLAPFAVARANDSPPIVGAIRWDAWCGGGSVAQQVERSPGPPNYHVRRPWFARVIGEGTVEINGDSQAVIEQEIAYTAAAELNYWAFVHSWDKLLESRRRTLEP